MRDEPAAPARPDEEEEAVSRLRPARGPRVDWTLRHASIHLVRRREGPRGDLSVEHLRGLSKMDAGDTDLEALLDALIVGAIARRPDISPTAPCRVYTFKKGSEGKSDRERLESMLAAVRLADFEGGAGALADRYSGLPRARAGVLLAVSAAVDLDRRKGLPFLFEFKCDFEDARRFDETSRVERVEDVILAKVKKVAVFPHFDGMRQVSHHLKIYQSSASDYFHDLFAVDRPRTSPEIFQEALHRAAMDRHADRLDEYFASPAPRGRELAADDRYIKPRDLLSADEVRYLDEATARKVREDWDRPVRVRITIDGDLRFEAEAAAHGRRFFIARRGNARYLIVRGDRFETSSPLTGLDFLRLEDIDEVVRRLPADEAGEPAP